MLDRMRAIQTGRGGGWAFVGVISRLCVFVLFTKKIYFPPRRMGPPPHDLDLHSAPSSVHVYTNRLVFRSRRPLYRRGVEVGGDYIIHNLFRQMYNSDSNRYTYKNKH